jgi:hypothetical protein
MSTATALEKLIHIDCVRTPQAISPGYGVPVRVVVTSINHTLKALEEASQLAEHFHSSIEIVAVQTVPYALPLDDPSVPLEFTVKRLEEMAAGFPVQIKISAYLCRDRLEALKRVLNPDCSIVMCVSKRWWPTREERMARKLQGAGYNVILVETE